MSSRVATYLWYDHGQAQLAVDLYTSLVPGSSVGRTTFSPSDNPSTAQGEPLLIEFSLGGHDCVALNGGPGFSFSQAMSLYVTLDDQEQVDVVWAALIANGGEEGRCGWCKDRWGVSWQIVPALLPRLLSSDDRVGAGRAMKAMLGMRKIDGAGLQRAYDGG